MGSHGRTALGGLVMGSVASAVLSHTKVPMLLLRAAEPPTAVGLNVGIAVDGSPYGVAAARYVTTHRGLFGEGARFTLLHAVPDYSGIVIPGLAEAPVPLYSLEKVEQFQSQRYDAAIGGVRAVMAGAQMPAREVRLVGDAGDEIAAHAKKEALDLIVLGSHGRGSFTSMVLGSVAMRVAARCRTPLLIVRP
jgi:nucleotide-binding universal stress UspA family protein